VIPLLPCWRMDVIIRFLFHLEIEDIPPASLYFLDCLLNI